MACTWVSREQGKAVPSTAAGWQVGSICLPEHSARRWWGQSRLCSLGRGPPQPRREEAQGGSSCSLPVLSGGGLPSQFLPASPTASLWGTQVSKDSGPGNQRGLWVGRTTEGTSLQHPMEARGIFSLLGCWREGARQKERSQCELWGLCNTPGLHFSIICSSVSFKVFFTLPVIIPSWVKIRPVRSRLPEAGLV